MRALSLHTRQVLSLAAYFACRRTGSVVASTDCGNCNRGGADSMETGRYRDECCSNKSEKKKQIVDEQDVLHALFLLNEIREFAWLD